MTLETKIRLEVYNHFVAHMQAPTSHQIAASVDIPIEQVRRSFEDMAERHILVLDPDTIANRSSRQIDAKAAAATH